MLDAGVIPQIEDALGKTALYYHRLLDLAEQGMALIAQEVANMAVPIATVALGIDNIPIGISTSTNRKMKKLSRL